MEIILFNLSGSDKLATYLVDKLQMEVGNYKLKDFPDGESYVQVKTNVQSKKVAVLCTLNSPNQKILPLYFLAKTLKDMAAEKVFLIAPYLAYMRQDKRFKEGEAITSEYFASLVSQVFDGMLCIDPHLHRRNALSEIYSIPTTIGHSTDSISKWIQENIPQPLIVGPDMESEQWVSKIAKKINADYIVLNKIRHGDKDVEISVPDITNYKKHVPVIVDDIISTAGTMIKIIELLKNKGMKACVCICIHAVFSEDSHRLLLKAGASKVISCNSIEHESNEIDISEDLVNSFIEMIG